MTVLCAWCQRTIREDDVPAGGPSHGICEACKPALMAEIAALPTSTRDEVRCCHGIPQTEWCTACESEV